MKTDVQTKANSAFGCCSLDDLATHFARCHTGRAVKTQKRDMWIAYRVLIFGAEA